MPERIRRSLSRLGFSLRLLLARRFSRAGVLALAGLVVTAVLGLDTNINQAYQLFTFLLALLLVSLIHLRMLRIRCNARRFLPLIATAGEPLRYRIQITNAGNSLLSGIEITEQLPAPAIPQPGLLPKLAAGETADLRMEITPPKRGQLHLTGIRVAIADIFGLLKTAESALCQDTCLIIPRRYPLPPIPLPGNRAFQQGGVALSTSVADSEEFQSLREYRPGDPMRLIHWKSWARSGKPVIREYQAEFFVRHALVLDTFAQQGREEIFEEAVSVAASFVCTVETRETLLDLMFVGADVYCETVGRGHGPVERLLEVLAGVSLCRDKPFQVLHNQVKARCGAMSGCICVLLAWDEERRDVIRQLESVGLPVLVLVITDQSRDNLPALRGDEPAGCFHILEAGKIGEGLARI